MITIVDYGVGNLFSLLSSLEHIGIAAKVSSDKNDIKRADKIILPGVGAFRDAIARLKNMGFAELILQHAKDYKPILGVCLGMQMLFSRSFENGQYDGLNLIKGDVVPLKGDIDPSLNIPHIGWNFLHIKKDNKILQGICDNSCVYFVHSYYASCSSEYIVASTDYGIDVPAVVANKNVFGCQFHPEKSSDIGLEILSNFNKI